MMCRNIIFILIVLIISGCNIKGGDTEMESERSITYDAFEPIFLTLEYVYSIEGADFTRGLMLSGVDDKNVEYTWWRPLTWSTFDEASQFLKREYNVELPHYIEIEEGYFLTISCGRRLKQFYYYEASRADTFNGQVHGRPVFGREYYPNTIFVYLASPRPYLGFICNRLFTNDAWEFNFYNNVKFEVMPYIVMDTGLIPHEYRPFQREDFK